MCATRMVDAGEDTTLSRCQYSHSASDSTQLTTSFALAAVWISAPEALLSPLPLVRYRLLLSASHMQLYFVGVTGNDCSVASSLASVQYSVRLYAVEAHDACIVPSFNWKPVYEYKGVRCTYCKLVLFLICHFSATHSVQFSSYQLSLDSA